MIVCHEHRFIFVHLMRTSGRAITTALAPHLGPDDIVTPVHRRSDDGKPAVEGRNHAGLGRHATALEIRERVGRDVWDSYFTFAMERNPWDKTLSRYWATLKKAREKAGGAADAAGEPSFEQWLARRTWRGWKGKLLSARSCHLPNHAHCYTDENGEILVDFVARMENRAEHLAEISRRIGIEIEPDVRVGTKTREKTRKPYTEFFDKPWMRKLIEDLFARDLELLGYRFGEPHPMDWIEPAAVR